MSLAVEDIRKNYKIENCEKNKYFQGTGTQCKT